MANNINWFSYRYFKPSEHKDDPLFLRQFLVKSSWGVRVAKFEKYWKEDSFEYLFKDLEYNKKEGEKEPDPYVSEAPFIVYEWSEMPN